MHARLDPGCEGAQQLDKSHRSQRRLMLEGASQGRLATVVETTQEQQVEAHRAACVRCRAYEPNCPECGFSKKARHGWRCSRSNPSWTEWLPWNWRPRRAAPGQEAAASPAAGARTIPVQEPPPARPASPPPARRQASAPEARKPTPYAVLGLGASASEAEVRKAYRDRAQQYHPDKVAHMAPEFREVAEKKMREINEAYELIRKTWA